MAQPTNPRKTLATTLFALAGEAPPPGAVVTADASNPYAFVVEMDGKRFRVIVKELA